jgi:hypothetical protein
MGALLAAPKIRHLVARLRGLLRVFRLALRCCGGLFATTLMALSKRAHASGCNSNSGFFAMPQPLSSVAPNAGIMLNNAGDRPLQRHPELAILAVEVIASWATVESFMLNVFVELMGGPTDKAATVFLALETQSAKAAAINAIADESLADEHKALLRAIIRVTKSHQAMRDKIAHLAWGDSPNLTEALLLIDPREHLDRSPKPDDLIARVMAGQPFQMPEIPEINKDKIFVFRRIDSETPIQNNGRIAGYWFNFRWILTNHPANRDGRLFARLSAEPEIAETLRRQAQQDRTPPAE